MLSLLETKLRLLSLEERRAVQGPTLAQIVSLRQRMEDFCMLRYGRIIPYKMVYIRIILPSGEKEAALVTVREDESWSFFSQTISIVLGIAPISSLSVSRTRNGPFVAKTKRPYATFKDMTKSYIHVHN
jgi:hypothetical protein